MRPPIYDFAYGFNASIPAQDGVKWLREAPFVDARFGPNFTRLYNQYASYGYNWELRFDVEGVTALHGQNWTLKNWDDYVTRVVNAYPYVHVWEVGNEVLSGQAQYNNGYLVQSGNLSMAYFNILKDAYQIVKGHDSSDTVIAFGGQDIFVPSEISLYNSGDFQADPSFKLAAQAWADGASQYCDAISLHPYADNTGGAWLLNETPVYTVASDLTVQQIWKGYITEYENLTQKPIWFTETGEPIDSPPHDPTPPIISNSLAKQAAFLSQSFTFLSSLPFTKAVFWFKLVGPSEYYSNGVLVFTLDDGLFNQDGTLRPVTNAFQTFSPPTGAVHDVAVTAVIPSKTVVGEGYPLNINVTAANQGDYTETFNVTVYANTTLTETEVTALWSGNSIQLVFDWNTTSVAQGNYKICAYAWPVQNETDTSNNNHTDGWVTVTIPGDINGDYTVSLQDLAILANAYGSKPGSPNWNPNADINGDNTVNLQDLVILALHYG
ncbi:MAG TPA: dockerin type I domain-containing protein [candidate division Zixibacteria bacterium]|nr:dockerin type I domain-containing protein [candidate division Zixibacteria bacterium]